MIAVDTEYGQAYVVVWIFIIDGWEAGIRRVVSPDLDGILDGKCKVGHSLEAILYAYAHVGNDF